MTWDEYYIKMARMVSEKSKDLSTKCGCILVNNDDHVISVGYNGFPRRVKETNDRMQRPLKYKYTSHAEENAVIHANRKVAWSKAYITGPPCSTCTRLLVGYGVREVVVPVSHNMLGREDWAKDIEHSKAMMWEAKVRYRFAECGISEKFGNCECGCSTEKPCKVVGCPHENNPEVSGRGIKWFSTVY